MSEVHGSNITTYREFSTKALRFGDNILEIPNDIIMMMHIPLDVRKQMLSEEHRKMKGGL